MSCTSFKRRIAGVLCGLLVIIGAYAPTPYTTPHAHAFFGDLALVAKEYGLDAIAWLVADAAWQSVTQSIVNWINSGFDGSPAFVTDLKENLGNLADAVAEDFIRGLDDVVESNTGFSIRAPFQDQIAYALREEYYRTSSSYGFDTRFPYQDCNRGGGFSWNNFLCGSRDTNNPYGRYMIARNDLFNQIDEETRNTLEEIGWGNGFRSWRGTCGPYGNRSSESSTAGGSVDLSSRDTTRGCSIRTPGAVIEAQLVDAIGKPLERLTMADELNEIFGALMSQLVNQVLGSTGLSGVSQPTSGGGRSYIDRATDPTNLTSGFAAVRIDDLRNDIATAQVGWQRIRSVAVDARQACSRDSARSSEADTVIAFADKNLSDASAALNELANIEAERVRLSRSGATQDDINALGNRYTSLLSKTGSVAEGTPESRPGSGTLFTQMTELAAECR
ncbi:MAG TPA: hypothetical protein VJA87_00630 [Candidatus Paceibacterota bacterium]